jgi:hypothetical protein
VKRSRKLSASCLGAWLSIQPKHSACSTASPYRIPGLEELRIVLVAAADDVLGPPAARVLGITHGVGLASAAIGANSSTP